MKKLLATSLVLSLSLGILSGCGNGGTSSAPGSEAPAPSQAASTASGEAAPVSGEKPVITFYHGYFQDDWQPAVEMRAMYEEFAKAHADQYTFEAVALETGNQGVYDKCVQEIALGQFPDIVDVSGMNIIPAAVEAGMALDLKPYIDEDADFKAGIGVNYEQNSLDGHIYTVRDQLETIGFWYNTDLFQKAGADTPDKWKTWADFDAAVDKLIASPDVETPFTMNQDWPTTILLSGYLMGSAEGRDFASKAPETFDNAAFRGAVDFISKSVLGKIDNAHFTAADSDKYREDFFQGKAAMLFNGVWEAGSFGGIDLDPAVIKPAVFPTMEEGKTAAIVSASPGYVINAGLDDVKKQACIDFVKYMTSKETASKIFEKAQAMPPSTAMDYDQYISGTFPGSDTVDESTKIILKSLAEACKAASGATYQNPTAGAVWGQDTFGAVAGKYAGIKDGSKTTDQIVQELDSILE